MEDGMKIKREFSFNVKVIQEGQPRKYADSEYEYIVESTLSEYAVKGFCTRYLRLCSQAKADWNRDNADSYSRGCYEFEKTGENTYRYYVREPYCD